MFHEDLSFSKTDMQAKEGEVWINKIWELCAPFPQGFQRWLLYSQVWRSHDFYLPNQSPSKSVNLNFPFTLSSLRELLVLKKKDYNWAHPRKITSIFLWVGPKHLHFLTPHVIQKCTSALSLAKWTLSNWPSCAKGRAPGIKGKERRVESVSFFILFLPPFSSQTVIQVAQSYL